MDECDLAAEREEHYRHIAIRRARAAASEEGPLHDENGKRVCLDCIRRIPQKRLKANPRAVRCVGCQAEKERSGNGLV